MDLTLEVDGEDRGRSVDARAEVAFETFGHVESKIEKLISLFHLFNLGCCYMSYAIGDDEEKEPRGKPYQESH